MKEKEEQPWFAKLGVISIGAQCGGPDDNGLSDDKVILFKCLRETCKTTYSPSVLHFALALRISGKFQKFGEEQICQVRRSKVQKYIGADIIVPEACWKGRGRFELGEYLVSKVREALSLCIARLKKDKVQIDAERLLADFDSGASQFMRALQSRNN
ncbi:MAG: hypothetical protein J0M24_07240 [Verrucomicrobia bacterium]|nr:hypothetical protein [Verrucomicrobiota bacterium]